MINVIFYINSFVTQQSSNYLPKSLFCISTTKTTSCKYMVWAVNWFCSFEFFLANTAMLYCECFEFWHLFNFLWLINAGHSKLVIRQRQYGAHIRWIVTKQLMDNWLECNFTDCSWHKPYFVCQSCAL